VEVLIVDLKLQAVTDSLGRFFIAGIASGAHLVSVRKVGFGPLSERLSFGERETVEADLLMAPTSAQSLPDANVVTTVSPSGKLAEFEERRIANKGGRFLTQVDMEKRKGGTMSDALRQLPGIAFQRAGNSQGNYVVTGRAALPGKALMTTTRQACFAAVMVDGVFVYGAGSAGEPNFDIDTMNPANIAGVEYYVGAGSMPLKYNAARTTCGLLVLWTK
jgi:hypothetical protein